MTAQVPGIQPQTWARAGGLLYLIIIAAGIFADVVVRSKLVVTGDAPATVHNISTSETLWRLGFGADMVVWVCAVVLALIFYVLMRPVSKGLSMLLVFFTLIDVAIESVNGLLDFAALFFANGRGYLHAFDAQQLQALTAVSLRLFDYGFGAGLVYFGCFCILLGYLILKAPYFPNFIGVLIAIAGICYLINSFALFLSPPLEDAIYPWILLPSFIGELSVCLWLLVVGVDLSKWKESYL